MNQPITETVITAPEGFQIDPEALKNNEVKFIPINELDNLPESWEELEELTGEYISEGSDVRIAIEHSTRAYFKNIVPKGYGEPMLALCQLLQLRDRYNGDWEPDYNAETPKFFINTAFNTIDYGWTKSINHSLAFKTEELRDKFFNAPKIRELIEIAKPLL